MPETIERELLTPRECSTIIGARIEWVHEEIRQGRLPAADIRTPGAKKARYKVRREDLDAYLAARAVHPAAPVKAPRRSKRSGRQWV